MQDILEQKLSRTEEKLAKTIKNEGVAMDEPMSDSLTKVC